MQPVLFIIANHGFQDIEFAVPKSILEQAGYKVEVAAGLKGSGIGKFGLRAEAQYALEVISGKDYAAVVFIGGPGTSAEYTGNETYFRLAREAKLLAAICIAPSILAPAGVLKGKKVTGWDANGAQQRLIETHGGIFVGGKVVRDRHLLTANGPEAAAEFGETLVKMLGEN